MTWFIIFNIIHVYLSCNLNEFQLDRILVFQLFIIKKVDTDYSLFDIVMIVILWLFTVNLVKYFDTIQLLIDQCPLFFLLAYTYTKNNVFLCEKAVFLIFGKNNSIHFCQVQLFRALTFTVHISVLLCQSFFLQALWSLCVEESK